MYSYYNCKYDLPVCNRSWSQLSTAEQSLLGIYTLGRCIETENKVTPDRMSTITVSDHETKQCIKLIDKSANKSFSMLNLNNINNLVSCTSQIVHLPNKIVQLPNKLSESELNNDDDELPESSELQDLMKDISKLQSLNNKLDSLPKRSCELQNLVTLNLSYNKLIKLPDSLSALKNLETLDLSNNLLEELPLSYANLRQLKYLDLSNNKLKIIPKCIVDGMVTLKTLDISKNNGIKMNIIPCTKNLEKFYAKDNRNCNKFPDWIVTPKFFNLKDINLSRTTFNIYSFVGKEGHINTKSLSMTSSNLSNTVLEMMIENMVCLEKLDVSNKEQLQCNTLNLFNEIPVQALKNFRAITEINFCGTALPSVTSKINQLINLKTLNISYNCILWLPEEICELEKLEYLFIDGNDLLLLPENIGKLKSLKEIRASHNALVQLPKTFEYLDNLRLADFYDNKIKEFPTFLSNMTNLQSLDIEYNFFIADHNIKIGEKLYFELYNLTYLNETRVVGAKNCETDESDDSSWHIDKYCDSDENIDVKNIKYNCDSDDNWETTMDTDDEFDPEDPKITYNKGKSKEYIYQKPQGFCPEDLHLKKIKAEVAAMKVYGSLPSYQIVDGQFDDVE